MKALLLDNRDGQTHAHIQQLNSDDLPAGEVLVDVHWSGLNYKDALAITGKGKIVRQFPMVPGIDFAGVVNQSTDARFVPGQAVLLTGWGVGEQHWGGLAQQARVAADWLLPMPQGLDGRRAMIIGTAGLTAMLCVMALEEGGVTPEQGDVLVTGASGGVGSTAVALLSRLGYRVTAVSGREENHDYLLALGAQQVLPRADFQTPARPLEKQRWTGAVDTVGGEVLAKTLAQMDSNGTVAACGLAGGFTLPTTVIPFILRNVRLQGVDSVMASPARRSLAWQRLAELLPADFYHRCANEITLEQAISAAADLMANRITGRTLVRLR
ncbi:oxidoreductase [Edwardsiella piscicida]|uniref:acrylyl-CoA reductase (NADPH) n=1 Tax=Edwardsiella piscicida TaxID=1263550 RepID=UPI00370D9E3A